MRIAVDVMGGDLGLEPLIQGCINFVRKTNTKIVVIGDENQIRQILKSEKAEYNEIEIAHTTEFISMNDRVTRTIKKKKNASVLNYYSCQLSMPIRQYMLE